MSTVPKRSERRQPGVQTRVVEGLPSSGAGHAATSWRRPAPAMAAATRGEAKGSTYRG
jgi:hypothetical protein